MFVLNCPTLTHSNYYPLLVNHVFYKGVIGIIHHIPPFDIWNIYFTRNTCMQQPLAISNQANNSLSLPDPSLFYKMLSIIGYKDNHKSGGYIFRFLLH